MSVQFVAFICLPALAQVFKYLICIVMLTTFADCPNKGNRAAGICHCLGVQPTQLAATRFGVRPLEQSCHSLKKRWRCMVRLPIVLIEMHLDQ